MTCGTRYFLLEWCAMRRFLPILAFSAVFVSASEALAQMPVPAASDTTSSPAPVAAPMTRPSEVLRDSLTALQQALAGVRLEKWKMSGELKDTTDQDIRSIERNFQETLPPLLATADGEPGSVAKVLPAIRNVDAVYDVALRVSAIGRLTAPAQQSAALDQALQGLAESRKKVGDQLQLAAIAEESRVGELQASLRASQAVAAAASQPPVAAPAPKPPIKPKKKVRPKPATPPADGSAPVANTGSK